MALASDTRPYSPHQSPALLRVDCGPGSAGECWKHDAPDNGPRAAHDETRGSLVFHIAARPVTRSRTARSLFPTPHAESQPGSSAKAASRGRFPEWPSRLPPSPARTSPPPLAPVRSLNSVLRRLCRLQDPNDLLFRKSRPLHLASSCFPREKPTQRLVPV